MKQKEKRRRYSPWQHFPGLTPLEQHFLAVRQPKDLNNLILAVTLKDRKHYQEFLNFLNIELI